MVRQFRVPDFMEVLESLPDAADIVVCDSKGENEAKLNKMYGLDPSARGFLGEIIFSFSEPN